MSYKITVICHFYIFHHRRWASNLGGVLHLALEGENSTTLLWSPISRLASDWILEV